MRSEAPAAVGLIMVKGLALAAFGSLREFTTELMRDRFRFEEVYEELGLPVADCVESSLQNEGYKLFQQLLFSKIVPALKKMALLTPRQRSRFADLGILQFEDWEDPFEAMKAEDQAPHAQA